VVQEAYVHGVSTRKVDELVKALGMRGISKSLMSQSFVRNSTRRWNVSATESWEVLSPMCGSTPPT